VEAQFAAAFLIGLLGGVHCVGMCGGIVGALTVQAPRRRHAWDLHLSYNAGRIASYAAAGAIMGMIGGAGLMFNQVLPVQLSLYVLANLVLVGLGLYLAGLGNPLTRLEALGTWLWRRVQPKSCLPTPPERRSFWARCGAGCPVAWCTACSQPRCSAAALAAALR